MDPLSAQPFRSSDDFAVRSTLISSQTVFDPIGNVQGLSKTHRLKITMQGCRATRSTEVAWKPGADDGFVRAAYATGVLNNGRIRRPNAAVSRILYRPR